MGYTEVDGFGEMYRGKCPNCGVEYKGWALGNPKLRTCANCTKSLEIYSDDDNVAPVGGSIKSHEAGIKNHDENKIKTDYTIEYVIQELFKHL